MALMVGVLPSSACAEEKAEASIRKFLATLMEDIKSNNRDAFNAKFTGPAEYDPLVSAVFNAVYHIGKFKETLVRKKGLEGWEEYMETEQPEGATGMTLNFGGPLVDGTISPSNGKYILSDGMTQVMVVAGPDGGWRIDKTSLLPPGAQPQPMLEFLNAMAQAAVFAEKKVATEDFSYGDLQVETLKKFQEVRAAAMDHAAKADE